MPQYILAIDQGTTSTRALIFDEEARVVASAQKELAQSFPQPGWVEHDPEEIWQATLRVCGEALESAKLSASDITAAGIVNQCETTVVWERATGRAVADAIVWQCRRTADRCAELIQDGHLRDISARTGLVVDAYFSATKLEWLLDRIPSGRARAREGELCFGTIDSWLLFRLTGGEVHATDITNASRTMLLNIHDGQWDERLLDLFQVPEQMLPEVRPSAFEFGIISGDLLGAEIPINGMAGDQHAALFGQACFRTGMSKCTYGTGAFLLTNTGNRPVTSNSGLLTTVAWQTGGNRVYALEGSIFSTGATVQWLRDGLGAINSAAESELLATMLSNNEGVYFVPAFVGLGAPHWDPDARGTISGLTRGSTAAHISRAALESTAYQVREVLEAIEYDSGRSSSGPLRVDGGQTENAFLMQFQADILDRPIDVAPIPDMTALGAAFLAGLTVGVWDGEADLEATWSASRTYEPQMRYTQRSSLYDGWRQAVKQARMRRAE